MTKFKYFIDIDKEEKWLVDMAAQGYQLKKAGRICYTFESTQPEDAVINMDYRYFVWDDDFANYITMFEDNGWEHIAGKKRSGFQYFKRKTDCEDEHIYTDAASRAKRYNRIGVPGMAAPHFILWFVLFGNAVWMQWPWIYVPVAVFVAAIVIWDIARAIKIWRLKRRMLREQK